ncbi:phosphate-starvation-inducible PsiE family protein [Halorubrum rubrum]|uniref:Phosphate-starvation-inducible PsiE family protein n=1 Tax=Halorubrum rubrum TaxID=1126240 RepID=A0ABD5QX20_9EURY|nr:phosphate-starvation-inducible PsiE family protein [Halorubrum rubrum]
MSGDDEPASPRPGPAEDRDRTPLSDRYSSLVDRFVRVVELAAATVFALLFAVGVFDLVIQIVGAVRSGAITDPLVVIGFIDTGLLLLIIVEVYQTVLAYVNEDDTRRIVRLVIYTGVIAMVRKAIIFRTGEYTTTQDALLAASAYGVIILSLVALLWIERTASGDAALLDE